MKAIYTDAYDLDAEPPMPVVRKLTLGEVAGPWTATTTAIIDSGADGSVVPLKLVEAILGTSATKSALISGVTESEPLEVTTIQLRCKINDFEVVTYLIAFGEEAVLGRDILNKLKTVLDGPPIDADGEPTLTMFAV